MLLKSFLAAVAAGAVAPALATDSPHVPSLKVPACPALATVSYDKTVPDKAAFPLTEAHVCYDDASIQIMFMAYNQTQFSVNASQGTNGDIWAYDVMEAFIYKGSNDPQTYLEFEVNPNNVTYQAFIYNPSKVRTQGTPFGHFYITEPLVDGLTAQTSVTNAVTSDPNWVSMVKIPLGLFNVDQGCAKGTHWRMNFFRTIVTTYPDQMLGAWSVPNIASFHQTPYFGHVSFI